MEEAKEELTPREKVQLAIKEKEKRGGEAFFEDVENDPPYRSIEPNEVDYLRKKLSSKIKSVFAEFIGEQLYKKVLKENQMQVEGLSNLDNITSGAIITGNHFHYFESASAIAIKKRFKHKKLYRVIKEGNFFAKGIFGFLFRNAHTLPLSSNMKTMMKFNKSVEKILQNGDFILIYPEQAMWWNYRKPRPHRVGAAYYAAKNNVPLISYFVTMSDLESKDENGDFIQKYTVHVLPPIYPDNNKSLKENEEEMTRLNYESWVKVYEDVYKNKLIYNEE